MRHVLVVDDDKNLRETLHELLRGAGYDVHEAGNARDAGEQIELAAPDLILCDWRMPVAGGEDLLRRTKGAGTPVIIMTAYGTGPNAIKAMELGAYDFLTKPLDADAVLAAIDRAIKHADLEREVADLRKQRYQPDRAGEQESAWKTRLVGSSPAWLSIFKSIGRVARTDISVLLQGESGTGKEVVAHAIHENSARSHKPFVVVNCAALPPELMESELFGHERGAFTGALHQKIGKFEAADSGTVFLDEIGELPLTLQPKLLRVLQEHTFERVGSTRSMQADFRVIAATNRNLEEEVAEKNFRPDLFYRLQAFTLPLPPLRERIEDVLPMAEYFLARFAERNGITAPGITKDGEALLLRYRFPGNVRELEHMMERSAVQSGGRAITAELLEGSIVPANPPKVGPLDYDKLRRLPFHESVAAWEHLLITTALEATRGNKSDAARQLGINRRLLYEKLQQFELS